jgi:GT2 family glycosyltransferase
MIHRSLLDEVGLFDETLPACEDYDLWLRICARHPVAFVSEPQIIKYGGHADQLSRRHWGMDRFRIQALEKILERDELNAEDRSAAIRTLTEKATILANGAEKRGKLEQAQKYRALPQKFQNP